MKALITGASRGIGRAIALRLARDAAARARDAAIVVAANRPSAELVSIAAEITALGIRVLPVSGDLADPATPQRLVDEALAFCDGLDTLVCNAGITAPAPLAGLALDQWDRLFAINSRAPWLLAQAARAALAGSRGAYVAIASMSGLEPHVGHGAYSASKAALIMLCRQLAQEWGPAGIRVNAVCPGMIRTPMTEPIYQDADIAALRDRIVPLQRVGRPEDVADVVAFLASRDARYVTGEAIRVDGGFASSILAHVPGLARSGE
ncbi:MAG: SDR family oxidoreductase [Rhizobiales bacterium]|nr:SDR family oxidoreductase [Hyphomicrobiales bacterium]